MQSQRPRRQRNRISFSCTNCRQGKYRCDRRTPCSTCVRRDNHQTCQYEEAAVASSRRYPPIGEGTVASKSKSPSTDQQRPATHPPSKGPDLKMFGYSKTGASNTLAILNELSRVDSAATLKHEQPDIAMSRSPSQNDKYLRLLRGLPPRLYIYILVDIFFDQVNWQYSIIDRNYFMSQLRDFYEASHSIFSEEQVNISSDVYTFPSLLFQVVGCTFQFLPPDYDRSLGDLCMGRSFDDLAKSYSDSGIELLALFDKESLNLISVQAGFLRITLLKSFGYVVEAYRMVGQVIRDAEEVGLHLDDNNLRADSVELTPSRLWYHEIRRRVMVNLFLWDSQMSIVLGKPTAASAEDWLLTVPLDAATPVDRTLNIPIERQPYEKPTQFTHRLIEYRALSQLPGLQRLLGREFNPQDYAQMQQHQQKMKAYIEGLPPPFRFENPDTKWDIECPWLKPQREYLRCTTWLFFVVTYRYSMFTVPQSRTEVIKAGIKVLQAQKAHWRTLGVQHYKLYALAFFTIEAATAIMVVYIAYPSENNELFDNALFHIKESIARMNSIQASNPFARPAADLIQLLMLRAESIHDVRESIRDDINSSPSESPQPQKVTPQYIDSHYKPSFQGESYNSADYRPSQNLDLAHSESSSTPPNFDFSIGGIIGPCGPTATMVDNNFVTVPDAWDPMILLERADVMIPGEDRMGSFAGVSGQGQDIYNL